LTAQQLDSSDAAVFDAFVIPRYLSLFGDAVLDVFLSDESAAVAHLGCRTGYPDDLIAERLKGGSIVGVDASSAAISLARSKGAHFLSVSSEYIVAEGYPTPLDDGTFTHALSLHPPALPGNRTELVNEMARLVVPQGQVLLAMPLKGSYQEVIDLLREYALKHDVAKIGMAADSAASARPAPEGLIQELNQAGFDEVDVDMRPVSLAFQSGRDFVQDPITRLLILPELRGALGVDDLDAPLAYMEEAINRYWSEEPFELTVNVGCATGRRIG
jgi:SAM-dependent methyltransferase